MTRTPKKLFAEFASTLSAIDNCRKNGNNEWLERHETSLAKLESFLPRGSGIDTGTTIDRDRSKPEKLVFAFSFHHMDENGYYHGWTDHTLIVTPSLQFGYALRITGRNRNDIQDYLYETFGYALDSEVWTDADGVWHSSQFEPLPKL